MTLFCQLSLTHFFIQHIVTRRFFCLRLQARHKCVDAFVQFRTVFRRARNNQRRARLVDQNGIHFIHNREAQTALHFVFNTQRHVVAQIIKTVFVVGAVSNIASIRSAFFFLILTRKNNAQAHAQFFIHRAHPTAVAIGEIIIHRHHMHALARQRIEIHRQRCHQRFTFTRAHLGNFAFVQHHAADHLHIKMAHTQYAARGFAHAGKGLWQQLLQCFTFLQAFTKLDSLVLQFAVSKFFQCGLECVDFGDNLAKTL